MDLKVNFNSRTAVLPILIFLVGCGLNGQSFSDDFNRPDGPVGNGWGSWNGTTLSNGQVVTYGSDGAGGGIYRSFPITYPVRFAFDFRSESPHPSCDFGNTDHPGGGWTIAFNAPGAGYSGAQYQFYQYYGSQPVSRLYLTPNGPVFDALPSGLPDFGPTFVHISGTVNADFSATLSIGGSTYNFGPGVNVLTPAQGGNMVLSNSSCGDGPFFFDNLEISIGARYNVCPLYDPTHVAKAGSTIPIKLQICDNSGNDLSSSSITVHAVSVTQTSSSITGVLVQDSGNANPDGDFRFASALGSTGGYIFNLSTSGLATGTYNLTFTVTGDSFVYSVLEKFGSFPVVPHPGTHDRERMARTSGF
jgi:hypothetical protein